jgi:hypothetical protein
MNAVTEKFQNITITPPDFHVVDTIIVGTAPLVIERFSVKAELMAKMAEGGSAKNRRERKARDYNAEAERAKHVSADGWEGFPAAALRKASISACRLVDFKMTLAKLSIFVLADGISVEDGIPLVRIYGTAEPVQHHTRNATGVVDVRSRPMYREWAARVRIQHDAGQFRREDVFNLLSRVGMQVGLCAGRPDSKASAGMGWGTFRIAEAGEVEAITKKHGIK